MKLVDADLFLENVKNELNCEGKCCECEYNNLCEIYKMVEKQHTAYDVDKVVEGLRLELGLADKEKERCAKENPLQFDEAKGYARGVAVALQVDKSGGIE